MGFNEQLKKEVRQKAAYQCCRCRSFGVEIHHILPQKDGGPDDIENAAPICPNCHTDFGDNPEKRKIIKEMRDWWYKRVDEMYGCQPNTMELLRKIDRQTEEIESKHSSDVSELKSLLKQYSDQAIENITSKNISSSVSGAITATRLADKVHANFQCRKCGTYVGLLIGSNQCPNCKTLID